MSFAVLETKSGRCRLRARGAWIAANAEEIDAALAGLGTPPKRGTVEFDLAGVERLDTAGAWLLLRERKAMEAAGLAVTLSGLGEAQEHLLRTVGERAPPPPKKIGRRAPAILRFVSRAGEAAIDAGRDVAQTLAFSGAVAAGFLRLALAPHRLRLASVAHHLEHAGLRAVPIVMMVSFLVGGIVAQQGMLQLEAYGAQAMTVNLVATLTLREVGALLAAIMIAGRSGSAFTAEIGSMKMREEIDALTVFGLRPIDVLVLPRLIALVIAMPLIVFLADLAALAGAGVIAWVYIDVAPAQYVERVRGAVRITTLSVGLIKAPFMALIIGMVACLEGLRVEGSAESLGRRTTTSVVKAIFMVIVVDGLFAVFFGAIDL